MKLRKLKKAAIVALAAAVIAGCGGGNGGSCTSNESCAENQFCKFTTGCSGSGKCTDTTAACTNDMTPVCSCDNLTFFNECWANAAAQSVLSTGECP